MLNTQSGIRPLLKRYLEPIVLEYPVLYLGGLAQQIWHLEFGCPTYLQDDIVYFISLFSETCQAVVQMFNLHSRDANVDPSREIASHKQERLGDQPFGMSRSTSPHFPLSLNRLVSPLRPRGIGPEESSGAKTGAKSLERVPRPTG